MRIAKKKLHKFVANCARVRLYMYNDIVTAVSVVEWRDTLIIRDCKI